MVSSVLVAIGVSLDSLSVGLAYGMKKVRFPLTAYIIITVCTTAMMGLSMLIGSFLTDIISPEMAIKIGAIILILIGLWEIYQGWCNYLDTRIDSSSPLPIIDIKIPYLGIIIKVLRDPAVVDFDNSKDIDPGEAFTLGLALGFDAFAAGFGASMTGFNYRLILMVGILCAGFMAIGIFISKLSLKKWWQEKGFILPGVILIGVGLIKLFLK